MSDSLRHDLSESNILFVHSSIDDANLTPAQFRVLAHLARRAGRGDAYPAIESIARICLLNPKTVRECLKVLSARRMLSIKDRPGFSRLYTLTKPSIWVLDPSQLSIGVKIDDPSQSDIPPPSQKDTGDPSQLSIGEGNPQKVIQIKRSKSSTLLRPQDPPPPPLQHCAAAAIKTVTPAKSAKTGKNAQSPEGLELHKKAARVPFDTERLFRELPDAFGESDEFCAGWDAFVARREKLKLPWTERAMDVLIQNFKLWGVAVSIASLNAAEVGNYKSLFPATGKGVAAQSSGCPRL